MDYLRRDYRWHATCALFKEIMSNAYICIYKSVLIPCLFITLFMCIGECVVLNYLQPSLLRLFVSVITSTFLLIVTLIYFAMQEERLLVINIIHKIKSYVR